MLISEKEIQKILGNFVDIPDGEKYISPWFVNIFLCLEGEQKWITTRILPLGETETQV